MYCSEETVRGLCTTIKAPITVAQITAAAGWADKVVIDPALRGAFVTWPVDPIPDAIAEISAMLTAYRIMSLFHGHNHEGEAIPNFYANGLKKDAMAALAAIVDSDTLLSELESVSPISSAAQPLLHEPLATRRREYGQTPMRRGTRRNVL